MERIWVSSFWWLMFSLVKRKWYLLLRLWKEVVEESERQKQTLGRLDKYDQKDLEWSGSAGDL